MRPYKRSVRVGDLIKEEVADIIMHKIKHKTLGFVTVTGVKLSDDLRTAVIYITVLNTEDNEKTVRKLNESKSFIKGELCKRIKIKFLPNLTFQIDDAVLYGRKMDKILDDINTERTPYDEDEDLF